MGDFLRQVLANLFFITLHIWKSYSWLYVALIIYLHRAIYDSSVENYTVDLVLPKFFGKHRYCGVASRG